MIKVLCDVSLCDYCDDHCFKKKSDLNQYLKNQYIYFKGKENRSVKLVLCQFVLEPT